MSEKRRDNKKRVLRNGESQRADGRYAFKYTDPMGNPHFVYSWKLESTDRVPAGKRDCVSLREKEKQIQKDLEDGISPFGANITVSELVSKYIEQSTGLSRRTISAYTTCLNKIKKYDFGNKKIRDMKLSSGKAWIILLQKEGGRYSALNIMKSLLSKSFQMAIDDDLIRRNPFLFSLKDIVNDDRGKRNALTGLQESQFLEFIKNDPTSSKYYEPIYILFNTGMRIAEFCGLTIKDIDFENKRITVNKQLHKCADGTYVVDRTKTKSGLRVFPMQDDVAECFRTIIQKRKRPKTEYIINGESGFLCLTRNDRPLVECHWVIYFNGICKRYNKVHEDDPLKITPHVCRHTFCTNMVKKKMNIKILQYLMGHASASTTLDVYSHVGIEDASEELAYLLSN